MGGGRKKYGLHHHIAIDRNPANALEMQKTSCGDSVAIMRLKLVKGAIGEDKADGSTKVLLKIVALWTKTNHIGCTDSYFTSVELLHKNWPQFIGVVKTAIKNHPIAYLGNEELENRGYVFGLVRAIKYFASTCPFLYGIVLSFSC